MNESASRLAAALAAMPAPGSGSYHTNLLRVANLGIAAGLSQEDVFCAIRAATPRGSRVVPDREIAAAAAKAAAEIKPGQCLRWTPPVPRAAHPTLDAGKMLRWLLAGGADAKVDTLRAMSPIPIDDVAQSVQALDALYQPSDKLFIGDLGRAGLNDIRSVSEWREHCLDGCKLQQHVIPNPLSGQPGLKKDGGKSYRCDACVTQFKFAIVEFDKTPPALRVPGAPVGPWPFDEQAKFWAGAIRAGWPVAALIHSGGKSIHAWLAVDAANVEEWAHDVEHRLFLEFLVPLGVDSACRNEARLSRMPGAYRVEKMKRQTLLYLKSAAGEVKS